MIPNITIKKAAFVLSNPARMQGALHYFGAELNRWLSKRDRHNGNNVMNEDWDNLIILDACRYDDFVKHHGFENGYLEKRRSLGSDSWGFIQHNFVGHSLHDTVYISANPFTRTIPDGTFHAVHNLLEEYWDDSAGTVRPGDVVDATRSLLKKYDDKRIIVHFMQPHFPFLGPTGEEISSAGLIELDENQNPLWQTDAYSVWTMLRFKTSDVTVDTVRNAYIENLNIVCSHVQTLLKELGGRSVITSDHGNLFGERTAPIPARAYGHPRDFFVDELVEVPWYIIDGDRRSTTSDPPITGNNVDESVIEDRLASLGYRER
jgi:hypothetical protein